MNRAERRRAEKETKQQVEEYNKNLKWFNNWTPSQQRFHRDMIHKIEDKAFKDLEKIMDSCYIAAMLQATELNLEQCKDICRLADKHMIETQNMINKEGEKYYMKINDEKLINEIREEVKGIIKDNRKINNLEIIRILDKEYDLGKKDYLIICKEVREELSKEVLKDIENDIDENEKELAALGKDIPSNVAGEISATFLAVEGEQGFELAQPKNNSLKIKSIEVEGEYGTYIKGTEGVKIGDKLFKNILEVQAEKDFKQAELKSKKEELLSKIKEINKQMHDLDHEDKEKCEMYSEIEQVFAM